MKENLAGKARILRQSSLFVNPSDRYPLAEKQNIFLVLANMKPLAEVSSGHWITTGLTSRETRPDDPTAVRKLLDSLGLLSSLTVGDHSITAAVTLDPAQIREYKSLSALVTPAATEAELQRAVRLSGKLFGVPLTAVEAFVRNDCLSIEEQDRLEGDADIPPFLGAFRMSRDHCREELTVLQDRFEILREYGLLDVG